MFVDDCENCKIVTGPIDGSIFIRTSKNCTVSTITRQLRFRDCENIKTYTFCPTDPAVESSFNIFFAPYNAFFPHLKELFVKGKFSSEESNHISTPHDFTIDKVMGDGAPHFLMLPNENFEVDIIRDGDAGIEEMFDGYSQQEPVLQGKVDPSILVTGPTGTFQPVESGHEQFVESTNTEEPNFNTNPVDQNNNNEGGFDFVGNVPLGAPGSEPMMNEFKVPETTETPQSTPQEVDQEELDRQMKRQQEQEERNAKIREKMEFELKRKNELREKAVEYMNNFNNERAERIENNKKENELNEEKAKKDKEELNELSKTQEVNHWEKVVENINLKASEYKGSKDVSRMRECIINRKNDFKTQK